MLIKQLSMLPPTQNVSKSKIRPRKTLKNLLSGLSRLCSRIKHCLLDKPLRCQMILEFVRHFFFAVGSFLALRYQNFL